MTRTEAIKRAAELKITLIKLSDIESGKYLEINPIVWRHYFQSLPMRTRKNHPDFSILGFIENAEKKINHYRSVLNEVV